MDLDNLTDEQKQALIDLGTGALQSVNDARFAATMKCLQCGSDARVDRHNGHADVTCACGWSASWSEPNTLN